MYHFLHLLTIPPPCLHLVWAATTTEIELIIIIILFLWPQLPAASSSSSSSSSQAHSPPPLWGTRSSCTSGCWLPGCSWTPGRRWEPACPRSPPRGGRPPAGRGAWTDAPTWPQDDVLLVPQVKNLTCSKQTKNIQSVPVNKIRCYRFKLMLAAVDYMGDNHNQIHCAHKRDLTRFNSLLYI